jgi:hypothetical protein
VLHGAQLEPGAAYELAVEARDFLGAASPRGAAPAPHPLASPTRRRPSAPSGLTRSATRRPRRPRRRAECGRRAVEWTLTARLYAPPLLAVDFPPPPYLASQTLFLTAQARFSACVPKHTLLALAWVLEDASGAVVLAGEGAQLTVAPGVLRAGGEYTARLVANVASSVASASLARVFTVRLALPAPDR